MPIEEHIHNSLRRLVQAGALVLYIVGSCGYRIAMETAIWWRGR